MHLDHFSFKQSMRLPLELKMTVWQANQNVSEYDQDQEMAESPSYFRPTHGTARESKMTT